MAETPNAPRQPLAPTSRNTNFLKTVLLPDTELKPASPKKSSPLPLPDSAVVNAWVIAHPAKLPSTNQNKRKAPENDVVENIPDSADDGERLTDITDSCDQVRRKIRTFIIAGEMKVGEFTEAIGCTQNNSYVRFMAQKGSSIGLKNEVYLKAFAFFQKREMEGKKMPRKKIKKGDERQEDLSTIHLEREAEINVPVYESCDEIRKKVKAYLQEPNVTQAGFLREIAKTYPDGRKIQSKVLNEFLAKKGAGAGNRSAVFYSSYVFFEKIRIRDGKPKSKHRLEMEILYKDEGGFDVKSGAGGKVGGGGGGSRYTYCLEGDNPWEDQYGKIHYN